MSESTILGVTLRRLIISFVNGMGKGDPIKVRFRGRQAYTDGRNINLPAIRDLAEIKYSVARALMGYAIHEVAHILYTDFTAIRRAIDEGRMPPSELIKKFENAIEDYRIEREMAKALPGTASDLTALRNLIHPKLEILPANWWADPRVCGPIALTWTGSQLNGFVIPAMEETLNCFPTPIRALIENWTDQMQSVVTTDDVVDLAIKFWAEANAFANASQPRSSSDVGDTSQPDTVDQSSDQDQSAADGANGADQPEQSNDAGQGAGQDQPAADGADGSHQPEQSDDAGQGAGQDQSAADGADGADQPDQSDDADQIGDKAEPEADDTTFDDESDDDPLSSILEPNAAFDDFLDNLRDEIANNPLPLEAPEASEGEVDPENVLNDIQEANKAAPNYISPDADHNPAAIKAAPNHYDDTRFQKIKLEEPGECQFASLRAAAAGTIATTARTIRRLLMSEEKRGVLRSRRSGQFDIRNISAVVRATGNCYKKNWERPAPETKLIVLTDFSGSMKFNPDGLVEPRALAVTGALALEEATRNTQIETSIYGYEGMSPNVVLYPFKAGRQNATITRRNIGSYLNIPVGCTPTGEAMAAVADILDVEKDKRRLLIVMTDGAADDMELCKDVVQLLNRRGIEVVAVGIKCDLVNEWCSNTHVINDITQLPHALLATIDPRHHKKMRKAA